jgi:hypothetical protein
LLRVCDVVGLFDLTRLTRGLGSRFDLDVGNRLLVRVVRMQSLLALLDLLLEKKSRLNRRARERTMGDRTSFATDLISRRVMRLSWSRRSILELSEDLLAAAVTC